MHEHKNLKNGNKSPTSLKIHSNHKAMALKSGKGLPGLKEPKLTGCKVLSIENRENFGDKEKDFVPKLIQSDINSQWLLCSSL